MAGLVREVMMVVVVVVMVDVPPIRLFILGFLRHDNQVTMGGAEKKGW